MFPNPAVLRGPRIDAILSRAGALAQAANSSTILLGSGFFLLPETDRRLTLLHEIAHLHQLRRPGRDPVQALEPEAWEAALAWSQGLPFRVQGRARSPLNALAIVQGGDKGHPFAPPWYKKSPVEPIGGSATISVKETLVIDNITLDNVMDQILAAKGTNEFVLVTHGDRSGLELSLLPGSTGGAQKEVIRALAADIRREEVDDLGNKMATPIKSEQDVADLARLKTDQVHDLRAKMNQIHALKLKHLAFRACNMGGDKDTMQAFRDFFGATSISAPTQFDSYGKFSPTILTDLKSWAAYKIKTGHHIAIEGEVGFGISNLDNRKFEIVAAARSKDAFNAWVKKHIVDGGWTSEGVIFHGLVALHPAPDGPPVYFVRDPQFIADIVNFAG